MGGDDTVKLTDHQSEPDGGDSGVCNQQSESASSCNSTVVVVESDLTKEDANRDDHHETANLLVAGNGVVAITDNLKVPDDELSPTVVPSKSYGFGSIASLNDQGFKSESSSLKSDHLREMDNPPRWGWVVVLAAWVIMIPIAGTLASFGNFVNPLSDEFNSTKLVTGWVGSLSFGFTVGMCPASTALFSVYGARKVASLGILGTVTGAIVSSFSNSIYMQFVTYSFLFGTGANFVYNTAMNLVGQYFPNKHQALATCLATAGISTGTLAINPLAEMLVKNYGWRRTWQLMSIAILVVGVICIATFRPAPVRNSSSSTAELRQRRVSKEKNEKDHTTSDELGQVNYTESKLSLAAQELKKNVFQKKAWSLATCANPGLVLWLLGTLFWSISFLFPHIFLVDYMKTISIEGSISSLVLLAYGCAELSGRFLCAFFAGRINFSLSYVYTICSTIAGVVAIITPQFQSLSMMYIYGISAGINSGILNALMFVTTMQLFGNEKGKFIWGYINVMLALGMVIGPIMAGGIYDATKSYETAFYVGGSVFILCGVVMFMIKPLLSRWPLDREETVEVDRKPIYSRRKKLREKGTRHNIKPSNHHHNQGGKWNKDVGLHLETLTAIDEEVKQQQQEDILK